MKHKSVFFTTTATTTIIIIMALLFSYTYLNLPDKSCFQHPHLGIFFLSTPLNGRHHFKPNFSANTSNPAFSEHKLPK